MSYAAPSRRARSLALALASILAPLAVVTGAASAAVEPKTADSEAPLASQFDQLNSAIGTIGTVDGGYGDAHAIRTTYTGGGGNGYARGIFNVDWRAGEDVWYSAAFFLPKGFKASMQGQVAIMRWDDFGTHPTNADQGGIVINGGDKRARLVLNHLPAGTQIELTDAFRLPEGRWFHLEVHQRLSATRGFNQVFVDGVRAAASDKGNIGRGRAPNRLRYGIVAVGAGTQRKPLRLQFDNAAVRNRRVGPNSAVKRTAGGGRVRAARYTPRVRRCMRGALARSARSGNAEMLIGAARRCVRKYARR